MSDKKKLPALKNATCIVCEDVRMEASGKLVLIGAYPGESIRFFSEISEENPGVLSLAFCFWFRDCRGTFDTNFALVDPNGERTVQRKVGERSVQQGQVLSFVIGFEKLQFRHLGKFLIEISLDEKVYEFPMFLGLNPPQDTD